MKRLVCFTITAAILIAGCFAVQPLRTVQAQGSCTDTTGTYSTGRTVEQGEIHNVLGQDQYWAAYTTGWDGSPSWVIKVKYTRATTYFNSMSYQVSSLTGDTSNVIIRVYNSGVVVASSSRQINMPLMDTTLNFTDGISGLGDTIEIDYEKHNPTYRPYDQLHLWITQFCNSADTTATPYHTATPIPTSTQPTNTVVYASPYPTTTPGYIPPTNPPIGATGVGGETAIPIPSMVPPPSCGDIFNPCGAMPWLVPFLPTLNLPSPTFRPTLPSPTPIPATVTPSPTHTPTNTTTPASATPAGTDAFSDIKTQIAGNQNAILTLQALATQNVLGLDGTQISGSQDVSALATLIGPMISTVKGVTGAAAGSESLKIVGFLILVFGFVLFVVITTSVWPIIMSIVQFVLKIITAIKP